MIVPQSSRLLRTLHVHHGNGDSDGSEPGDGEGDDVELNVYVKVMTTVMGERRDGDGIPCCALSHIAFSLKSMSRIAPLLLLYINRLQLWGWY